MQEEYTKRMETMLIHLTRLETKVDGINNRLDISNGRLSKNENKLYCLSEIAEKNKLSIRIIFGIISALGLGILSIIIDFFKIKI